MTKDAVVVEATFSRLDFVIADDKTAVFMQAFGDEAMELDVQLKNKDCYTFFNVGVGSVGSTTQLKYNKQSVVKELPENENYLLEAAMPSQVR